MHAASAPSLSAPGAAPSSHGANAGTPGLRWGLGLDGGGTATRWALASSDGHLRAEGAVDGISALQLADAAGLAALQATAAALSAQVAAQLAGAGDGADARVAAVVAGLTGFGSDDAGTLQALLGAPWGLPPAAVRLMTDIELQCHAAFAPGQGIVVYAGTGSIAAHVDAAGTLHRAGGRGAVIDDAGGGHWIAREALKRVWRAEDAAPGTVLQTALGRRLAAVMGGSDWAATRAWVYGASRGELGILALAVAEAAHEGDAQALALLQRAGVELARLAQCLQQRLAPAAATSAAPGSAPGSAPATPSSPGLPLALAGRVWDLHPAIESSLRAALPAGSICHWLATPAHHQAALLAATQGRP